MKKRIIGLMALLAITIGCSPIERKAYNIAVGAKAFLDSEKKQHPECPGDFPACKALDRATAAKDALIDAAVLYCAGPDFESGGECNAPKKGDAGYDQAQAKLKAAIAQYQQIEQDVRAILGK